MSKLNLNIYSKYIILAVLITALTSCMPKVEDGKEVEEVTITSHEIEKTGTNAKIILHGTCPKATTSYRVNVEEAGYDVYGPSITAWSEGSGIPIGICTNGVLKIDYPVPNPNTSRMISFRVRAKLGDGKLSLYPAIREVDYTMPSSGAPGFAVTSGGMFGSNTDVTLHASAGIVHSYNPGVNGSLIVPGGSATLRSGLQGIIYNDAF